MTKPITIKDVAKRAEVGLGTVSRVLNNHPSVNEDTRQKVLTAIKELDYNPNAIARSLKAKVTKSIGVMIPDISSAFYPEIVRGVEDIASEYKYNIILCNTDLKKEIEKQTLSMLKEKKVDGIIFISNTIDDSLTTEFEKLGIPIVLVATKDLNSKFYSVIIDNEAAAFTAVNYLCNLGHKRIALIAGPEDDPNAGVPRINGYIKALKANDIKLDNNLITYGNYGYRSGFENMSKLMAKGNLPTAVFAASDTMAVGAASAILQAGYRIPEDISIIGFDGIEIAEFFYPPITTIKQPRYQMGAQGMHRLIKLMNNERTEHIEEVLSFELIQRHSCKKVKGE
ncbi:MAG: LacI family DNA-binding transcriptional regulator [Bacillota bacterium]